MIKLKIFNQNKVEINSYLLIKEKEAILIDPGFNGEAIIKYLGESNIDLKHVILTHGHFDHIRDIQILAKRFLFDLLISNQEISFLKNDNKNYAFAFGSEFILPKNIIIKPMNDGEKITLLSENFEFILTPGHTKGSMCIKYQNWLFSGDTIFYDSIGRTDLFSGSSLDMQKSLKYLKERISNQMKIYPGHGRSGKWIDIKNTNLYLK